jgi:GH43 family beta-xylosidase
MVRETLITCAALLAALPALPAQQPYRNPVLAHSTGAADPFLLKWNGEYYLYATGDPIRAYHSKDLVQWDTIGGVLAGSRAADAWNQADVWAPEVFYSNGKFYLYYTASRASEDWRVGEMARRIGVGVSDSPRGPFVDIGRPVTPGWGIDGHIFRDPDDGREYMFYSYLYEPRLPGAGIVVDVMNGAAAMSGRPSHVTRGSEAWEDKDGDPGNGSLRYTNEAPTVLKRNGRYYMMYSGGSWDLPTYSMAYAHSDRVLNGGLDGSGWTKVVPPILRSTPLVQGPGHNSTAKGPNNVDDITAYHARTVPFVGPGDRQTFIDRLYWHRDRLFMEQPTTGLLAPPDRPQFGDIFDRTGTLGAGWKVLAGDWRITDEQARASGNAIALVNAPQLSHYVFEANVRGAGGVVAWYRDARNRIDVWLDPSRRQLVTSGTVDARAIEARTTSLPASFRFEAYHQLLITRNAGRMQIMLDGVVAQTRAVPPAAANVGLMTRQGNADFDGVALTSYFEDGFDDAQVSWTAQSGTWLVEEGALHQVAGGGTRALALKGDPAANYEFTASVRIRDNESTASKVGIVAAAAGDALVLAGFDRTIWPYARFWVQHIAGGQMREALAVDMPRGFDYNSYHTLRTVKQGNAFTFYLDGDEIAAARFPIGEARAGLFTEGARAAFDDASLKQLGSAHNLVLDGSFETERWEQRAGAVRHPWQLSGAALPSMCCAHTGIHRLLLNAADARATQEIAGLAPGSYTLVAWALAQDAEAEAHIRLGTRELARRAGNSANWQQLVLEFDMTNAAEPIVIVLAPKLAENDGFAAFDDVYLFKR